ncbi:MAG TPA: metal ABC transporter permease [Desulfurivibrionaceae bacterium]|nr:metal ABC transporter permease [Desulfurivibrionaceae bacterium]
MVLTEIFQYGFMLRALVGGVLVGILCGVLGVFLVLRRLSLIGDGLAHVTFGSVALAMVAGIGNAWLTVASVPLVLASALGIQRLAQRSRVFGDAAIGIVSASGIAAGVVLASMAGGFTVDLFSYLFGNILAISNEELWLATALCLVVLGSIAFWYRELFAITFDEELAQTSGINVGRLNSVLVLLTALTVVLAMKVVGIMLISALLILPAATALQFARGFRTTLLLAAIIAILAVVSGIFVSFIYNLPSGATIVLVNLALFLASLLFPRLRAQKNPAA